LAASTPRQQQAEANLSYEYQRSQSMNRREAIIAGMAGMTAAVAVPRTAKAQASLAANPELEQIRALPVCSKFLRCFQLFHRDGLGAT
jgi:hypothetical protein